MHHIPSVDELRRDLRTGTCANCPSRSARGAATSDLPRPCEASCPVFAHLPTIWELARLADPMLSDRETRLRSLLRQLLHDSSQARHFSEGFIREAATRIEQAFQP